VYWWCVVVQKEQKEFKPSAAFCKSRQKILELCGLDFDSDFFPKNRLEKQTKKMRPLENPNRIFLNATTVVQVISLFASRPVGCKRQKALGKIFIAQSAL